MSNKAIATLVATHVLFASACSDEEMQWEDELRSEFVEAEISVLRETDDDDLDLDSTMDGDSTPDQAFSIEIPDDTEPHQARAPSCPMPDDGCSAPYEVTNFIDPLVLAFGKSKFTSACRTHDRCYDHGQATYCKSRKDCDRDFLADMRNKCDDFSFWDLIFLGMNRITCKVYASEFYVAVRLGGASSYRDDDSIFCEYDGTAGCGGGPTGCQDVCCEWFEDTCLICVPSSRQCP